MTTPIEVQLSEADANFETPIAGILDRIESAVGQEKKADVRLIFPGQWGMIYAWGWMDSESICWNNVRGRPLWAIEQLLKKRGYTNIESHLGSKYGDNVIALSVERAA
jgi:hypothetical protein